MTGGVVRNSNSGTRRRGPVKFETMAAVAEHGFVPLTALALTVVVLCVVAYLQGTMIVYSLRLSRQTRPPEPRRGYFIVWLECRLTNK
jgi:hypothetical protein